MERGRNKFQKHRRTIFFLAKCCSAFPMRIRKKLFEHFRATKGVKGIAIRYIFLKSIAKKCGNNVGIHSDCYILSPEKLKLGNNVSIQPMCYVDATGGISIGNDVSIAHGVTIMSTEHRFDRLDIPIKDQDYHSAEVCIEDNVWIGAKATVLSGNKIEGGSIVAAGAVVTKDIPADVIAAGVPARAIKKRV